ncbi:MAG TPA: hypothetical protein DCQ50_03185 [Chryseobacterium sp.]|nr:hypothetical protein [Chryseobacterium sp.]
MNTLSMYILKALRKLYVKAFNIPLLPKPICEQNPDKASRIIYEKLMENKPCMIGRFGSTELVTMTNYLGVKYPNKNLLKYIKGESLPWWWNENIIEQMQRWSGFFPPTQAKIEQFCELMLEDMKEVDVLGSWLADEKYFDAEMRCRKVHIRLLEPFWASEPWTRALKGKKILVIHPFAETISQQYKKREQLFDNKDTLPDFTALSIIKAVQTLGQPSEEYSDWFEALDSMKHQIDKADFDVCLIGAGAYGFPLAAHVKRIGKKAVHLGGALQLLFGIKGKRWEDPNYGVQIWGIPSGFYPSLMNQNWVHPLSTEKPLTADKVEGACYW